MRRARTTAALAAALGCLGAAPAQALPPSLTADTNYAFSGVAEYDATVVNGVSEDNVAGAAIDAGLDRHYAIGEGTNAGDADVVIVARRGNGTLDPSFGGDGVVSIAVTPGARDLGVALAVLPDHRLRFVGATDVNPGLTTDLDVVAGGLLADGTPDPAFGGADGLEIFAVGPGQDLPSALALDDAGRLAITGSTVGPMSDDTFAAVREADGGPAAFGTGGSAVLNRGGGSVADRGTDVAWGPGGSVATLIGVGSGPGQSTKLHVFTPGGVDDTGFASDGDLDVQSGADDIVAGGLLRHGGHYWLTGTVSAAGDLDGLLGRVDTSGAGLQTRRFDMRGTTFPASQQVSSRALDLTIVPGDPDTLVAVGSVSTDRGSEVGAAAFNGLAGDLASLLTVDMVIPVSGQGSAVGVAGAANGTVAMSSSQLDYSIETGSGSNDTSIGMSRLLVDAEKQCDLALSVERPLELVLRGSAVSPISLRAVNNGKRACGGTVTAPAPYALAGPTTGTGRLEPGEAVTLPLDVSYGASVPVSDELALMLSAPADVAPADNVAKLKVAFSFCDLALRADVSPRNLGLEGARRYEFSVMNLGTATCRAVTVGVAGQGRRSGLAGAFTVPAGQSVTEEVDVALIKGSKSGRNASIFFSVTSSDELKPANNSLLAAPRIVRVGDSNIRQISAGRTFRGTARRANGARLRLVEVAIRRLGGGCRWIGSRDGELRSVERSASGACAPLWIRASGARRWELRLNRKLAKGRYQVLSRAVLTNGIPEARFTTKDRNKRSFRVR